jgi:hypothetical protein
MFSWTGPVLYKIGEEFGDFFPDGNMPQQPLKCSKNFGCLKIVSGRYLAEKNYPRGSVGTYAVYGVVF